MIRHSPRNARARSMVFSPILPSEAPYRPRTSSESARITVGTSTGKSPTLSGRNGSPRSP